MQETLPDATIASHVDMKFICHSINLFRCQTTVAEHANLFARINKVCKHLKKCGKENK